MHHVVRVFLYRSYNLGVVTAVPFAAIGALLLYTAYAEMKKLGSTERQRVAA